MHISLQVLSVLVIFLTACGNNANVRSLRLPGSEIETLHRLIDSPEAPIKQRLNALQSVIADARPDSVAFCRTMAYYERRFSTPGSKYRNDDISKLVFQEESTVRWY